uniref:B9 domain-containing protein 1 n=1 Tax=Ditylenchus dipsaci TaxID=166011 RepID=A0A915D9C6_9BILA
MQRKAFKYAFDRGPKPSRKVREQLAKDTGLSVRVVQVWFQNQRAKMKKEHRKVDHQVDHHKQHSSSASMNTVSTDSDGKSAADDEMKSPMGSIKSDSSEMDGFDMEDDDRSSIITDISRLSSTAHLQEPTQPLYGNITKNVLGDREKDVNSNGNHILGSTRKAAFSLLITGQIETAQFHSVDNIYCKYFYAFGPDWQQVSGLVEGISPTCQRGSHSQRIVLNTPLEATFTSSNPFGWPKIVLSCYGMDKFGNDAVIRGYGSTYIPSTPGRVIRQVPIFVPQASTGIQKIIGYFTGRRAEFVDPRIVSMSEGREVTRVSTHGMVTISISSVFKDLKKLGYDSLPQTISKISDFPLPTFEEFSFAPQTSTANQEATQLDESQVEGDEEIRGPDEQNIQTINEEEATEEQSENNSIK